VTKTLELTNLRASPGVDTTRPGLTKAFGIDGKLLAWTLFAVGMLVIATYALAASPQPDVDNIMPIGLTSP
jgi:hypothetical protein